MKSIAALVLVLVTICHAAELVPDEPIRFQALRLIFPRATISVLPTRPDETPYPVTDPLGRVVAVIGNGLDHEHEYEVVSPAGDAEKHAASDITRLQLPERWTSDKRQLRMQLYRWTGASYPEPPLYLAVIGYTFMNANPPRCCRAVGRVLLISSTLDRVLDSFEEMPYAFTAFTSIRFFDTGGHADKLIVSADFSGVASIGVKTAVFDIVNSKLNPLLSVDTVVLFELENADVHTMTFDEHRRPLGKGREFVFIKKTYVEKGKVLGKPATTKVSYPVGTGIPLKWQ